MNQLSRVAFGSDATVLAGYAQSANERLGNIDFVFENAGTNEAYIKLSQFDDTTSPSGYKDVGNAFTVVPGGTKTQSYVFINKRVGFFGSGNTMVGISAVIRNKGDLRGGQIDIVPVARRSWGYDRAFNRPDLTKKWGYVNSGVNVSTQNNTDAGTGTITGGEGV